MPRDSSRTVCVPESKIRVNSAGSGFIAGDWLQQGLGAGQKATRERVHEPHSFKKSADLLMSPPRYAR